MKKLASFFLIFILNTSFFAVSNEVIVYNNDDINTLQEIYNHNTNVLNHWDLSNPGNIKDIEWECNSNIYNLVSLDLSNTDISGKIDLSVFDYIEYYNFSNTYINEIVLPDGLAYIPQNAFKGCGNLEYINIPQSINVIENNVFKNCSNLKSIILNSENIVISSEAFSGCVSLECIINANNITSIGRNAFTNCGNLTFYGNNTANSYIESYTQSMNYTLSSNNTSTAIGYVSKMTSVNNQTSSRKPYKLGIAYLYDENNNLLEQTNLNNEGEFSFSNLSIGYKYRLVIDGEFAIARSYPLIVTDKNYIINTKDTAIAVITCDFNKDGIITNEDVQILYSKCGSSQPDKVDLYDLNGDNYVSVSDVGVVYSIIAYFNKNGYVY